MRAIVKINPEPVRFVADSSIERPVMVCSHERSGTHFVINTIASNSCFSNDPYFDFDLMPLGSFLNFYDRDSVKGFFARLAEHKCASVIKNHFAAEFFLEKDESLMLGGIAKIIYVVRNPVDVMLSYHRFINYFSRHQAPRFKDTAAFLNAAPAGQMLRYQGQQADTVLDRWKVHLLGWLKAAAANDAHILVIQYRDLDQDHAQVTKRILEFLNIDCGADIVRPDRTEKAIYVPEFRDVSQNEKAELNALIVKKLGYVETFAKIFPELYAADQNM